MSSPSGSLPAPPEGSKPPASGYNNFEGFGLKIPLPPWAVYCLAILVILGVALSLGSKLILPIIDKRAAQSRADQAELDKKAAQDRANKEKTEKEKAQIQEYQKHFNEGSTRTQKLFDTPDIGSLTVTYYPSDGCLLVKRRNPGPNEVEIPHWILAQSIQYQQAPGRLAGDRRESRLQNPDLDHPNLQLVAMNLDAAIPQQPCRGRCQDPHGGEFQSWSGQQVGCFMQIWRKWPDGCLHYQWYNSCYGYWDSWPNGAPKVYWTCCVH